MATVSTTNYPNTNIHSTEEPKKISDWTNAKIKQFALYFFAMLLAYAAIAAYLLIPAPYNFLPAAAGLPIFGIIFSANQIKDYDSPEKLKAYKAEAAEMTFQKIHDEFGIKNATKYELVHLDTLKEKFTAQVREMDFCSVLSAFNLSDLSSVATPEHIALLQNLKTQESRFRAKYEASDQSTQARSRFHRELNRLEERYNDFKLI